MEKNDYNIALIIDADNISYKYLDTLFDELKEYGRIAYKRIYGDFTDTGKQGWAKTIKENGIVPIQEYATIKGKNTTDIAMVIDAMDILYQGYVDCFCIATSDSDFTRLISRLKENNMFVVGAGESKSNKAFVKNYDRFIILDTLYSVSQKENKKDKSSDKDKNLDKNKKIEKKPDAPKKLADKEESASSPSSSDEMVQLDKDIIYDYVEYVIDHEDGDDGWVYLAVVMQKLYAQFPEFNTKLFKARNTREFFKMSGRFLLKSSTKKTANDSTLIKKVAK